MNKNTALRLAQSHRVKAVAKKPTLNAANSRTMIDFALADVAQGGKDQVNLMIQFDATPAIIKLLQDALANQEEGSMIRLGAPGLILNVQHDELHRDHQ